MNTEIKTFALNPEHCAACHERWITHRSNLQPDERLEEMTDDEAERWANEQCGQCRYYVLLVGPLQSDWGVCSNPASEFDGRVKFEHDGCPEYDGADAWVSEYFLE